MKKIFRIEIDKSFKTSNTLLGTLSCGHAPIDWENFIIARTYAGPPPDTLDAECQETQQALNFGNFTALVVTTELADALEYAECRMQRFLLRVKGSARFFELLNVLDWVKRYPEDTTTHVFINWSSDAEPIIELRAADIEDKKLFRISGERPIVCLTEEIVEVLRDFGVEGFKFSPLIVKVN